MSPGVTSSGTATTRARRGTSSLLRDRTFGPFFAGKLLSVCGIWLQNLAAAVLMYDLTESAVMVGAVSTLQFAGPLLLSLWAGALNDRADRRLILIWGRGLAGVAMLALAVVLGLRGTEGFGGPPVLLALVTLTGIGLAISGPAQQAIVPALVKRDDLEDALALSAAAPSIARTIGPALGAALLLAGQPAIAFAVAGLSHWLFSLVLLLFVPGRPHVRPSQRPGLWGGVRYLREDRKAGSIMIGIALIGFAAEPVVTLTPSLAAQMGGGSETVGLFAMAFGVGGLLQVAMFGPLRRLLRLRRSGMAGFVVAAAGLLVTGLSGSVWAAAAGFLVAGLGFMLAAVALNTRIQRRVPDELRGRVMALWSMMFIGARPFAAMLVGWMADSVSLRAAFLGAGAVVLAATFFARADYRKVGLAAFDPHGQPA